MHIGPDETDALSHIPPALLVPAPMAPRGYLVMGYDADGRCPMLIDDRCSIYEHRPRTCRTYDCRVFAATGVEPSEQPLIAATVSQWRFSGDSAGEETLADAVRAAERFFADHSDELGDQIPPSGTLRRALAVVASCYLFESSEPTVDEVTAALDAVRRPTP